MFFDSNIYLTLQDTEIPLADTGKSIKPVTSLNTELGSEGFSAQIPTRCTERSLNSCLNESKQAFQLHPPASFD